MQTADQRRMLGAFVRARREGLSPDVPGGRRRTPGLRREELASRAGISVTWVAWIEQGREVRASAHSLSRLARALRLSRAERTYLFELAGRHDPDNPFTQPDLGAPASVAAMTQALDWPAYGLDPAWTICCINAPARRLFVGLTDATDAGQGAPGDQPNLLRYMFLSPAARTLIPDWPTRARRLLAEFRIDFGRNPSDPRVRAMVDWLLTQSAPFREAWAAQSVAAREGGRRSFAHPEDGLLWFEQHTLHAADRPDFKLVALEPVDPVPDER